MGYKDPAKQREFQRLWTKARRIRFTAGVRCVRCGSGESIHWHHRDPATKLAHQIWSWTIPRIEAELRKCEPLCRSCHEEHHAALLRSPCGTEGAYGRGCRCAPCKAAHAGNARAYRARRLAYSPARS